ncbi:MAG: PspC domain-containing protein [bacterium]|nr:PspC domain-containing protein [bacterium]
MESTTIKRLTRSNREKIFAGLCGGAAEYLGIDPALARIMFVAVTLITGVGPGTIVYLAGWIIVPQSDPSRETSRHQPSGSRRVVAMMLLAIALLGLGIAAVIDHDDSFSVTYVGPVLVLMLAIFLLVKRQDATSNSDTYAHPGEDMRLNSYQTAQAA